MFRNVVLFNYPSADMRTQSDNETFYPRAADELREIENLLGPAVVLMNINKLL